MTDTARSPMQRTPKEFYLFGQAFKFELIPSEHFQAVLVDAVGLLMNSDSGSLSAAHIKEAATSLLSQKLYDILFDVLKYQNDANYSTLELKKKSSPLEIAQFTTLLLEDDEVFEAIEVLKKGLGKLQEKVQANHSATESFTPSSPTTSDSTDSTSTSD